MEQGRLRGWRVGECERGRVVVAVVEKGCGGGVWWKVEGMRGGRGIGGTWWWWEGLVARDRSSARASIACARPAA